MKNLTILALLLLLVVSSCSLFKKKNQVDKDVIARVNDEYLYASDIQGMIKGLKGKDSVEALKSYADTWVRKKLLLQKAEANIPEDDISITRKVDEYRESLILYEYEKALINKRLDTAVAPAELQQWYEKMKNDFPLENDVYLVYYIKLKKDASDIDNARKWIMKPADDEDLRKLAGYCKEYAVTYIMDQGIWYDRDLIVKNLPVNEADVAALNATHSFKEFKTDGGTWFIKIAEVAKKDQPAPMQFIHDKVVRAIIEKRRMQLIEKIYDKIYQDGIKSKSFEIIIK